MWKTELGWRVGNLPQAVWEAAAPSSGAVAGCAVAIFAAMHTWEAEPEVGALLPQVEAVAKHAALHRGVQSRQVV